VWVGGCFLVWVGVVQVPLSLPPQGGKMVGLFTQLGLASPKEHITPVLWRGRPV